MGFLDNLFKDDKKGGGENNKKKSNNNNHNPLGNMFGGRPRTFHGTGQSLGGTQPGTVLPIVLTEPGPLGVRVEKRPNSAGSTAIVNQIVPGGQAEAAGMQRGDILCFAGSNGQEEIMYDMFLEMAKSTQRPIHLEVRRISTLLDKQKQQQSSFNNQSADAEARRKAVIAAAEAREKKHKTQSKPMKQVTKSTLAKERQQRQQQELLAANNTNSLETEIPISEASRKAALAAKQSEAQVAAQLGYNPYETSRATAGQARNATTTVQHGALQSYSSPNDQQDELPLPNVAAPPRNATEEEDDDDDTFGGPLPSEEFQHAFATVLSSADDADKDKVRSSLTIMTKLLINATTKQDEAKFRKVRLANAKIKSAIVDMEGAIELMMSCGFVLQEQDGESVLIYPAPENEKGGYKVPEWIPAAIRQMEKAQK